MRRFVVLAALVLAACGGGDGQTDQERLVDLLQSPDTADLAPDTAECVAEHMIDAGITDAEIAELADYSEGDTQPAALDFYTAARLDCVSDEIDTPLETLPTVGD